MNITEVLDYAQTTPDHTKVRFKFTNFQGKEVECMVLDAWFRTFCIVGENSFIFEKQWKEVTGDSINFQIISNDDK